MKHFADEFDTGGLIGVLLFEMEDQPESSILEGSVGGTDNDGVPGHNIVGDGGSRYSCGWVCLHSLKRRTVSYCIPDGALARKTTRYCLREGKKADIP